MRRTEAERRGYVEVFHRSGLRPVAFCEKHGIHPKTFYTWRKRYVSDDVGEYTFLPLQLKSNEAAADGCVNPPRILSFKTQKFCLEVALDTRHTHADIRSELKLIVQTLQEVL